MFDMDSMGASTTSLFDRLADKFARETDQAIQTNTYARGRIIVKLAQRTIPPRGQLLDFGCGPGRLSLLLARAGFRVCGADISEGMVKEARTLDRHGVDLEFELLEQPGTILQPESWDAIVCSSVIEYVVDPDALLRQFHRALRGSGVLIISYANRSSLWRQYWNRRDIRSNPMYVPHHQSWHWREFRALLLRNGFSAIDGPIFFDSPFDRQPWDRVLCRVSLGGTLGVVAARPDHQPG